MQGTKGYRLESYEKVNVFTQLEVCVMYIDFLPYFTTVNNVATGAEHNHCFPSLIRLMLVEGLIKLIVWQLSVCYPLHELFSGEIIIGHHWKGYYKHIIMFSTIPQNLFFFFASKMLSVELYYLSAVSQYLWDNCRMTLVCPLGKIVC